MVGTKAFHIPVLVNEVLEVLEPCLNAGTVVDATVGGGGHTEVIARRIKELGGTGQILGIDVDPEAIKFAAKRLQRWGCQVVQLKVESETEKSKRSADEEGKLISLVRTSYANIAKVVEMFKVKTVTAVLMDLGVSSFQLFGRRGFSYESDDLLDMRFDPDGGGPTALDVLHRASEGDLRRLLLMYGEERFSSRIAKMVYQNKKRIRTSGDLADIVRSVVPGHQVRRSLARVFQALRIVVNRELENLEAGLSGAIRVLSPGGRLAVICYQSGEDRCFKEVYRREREKGRVKMLNPKAIRPGADEVRANPRAHSARLRVLEVVV